MLCDFWRNHDDMHCFELWHLVLPKIVLYPLPRSVDLWLERNDATGFVVDPPVGQPCWFPNINQQLVRLNFDAGKAQREDMDWRPSDLVVVGTSVSRLWLPGWQSHVRLVLAPKLLNGSFLSHSLNNKRYIPRRITFWILCKPNHQTWFHVFNTNYPDVFTIGGLFPSGTNIKKLKGVLWALKNTI